MTLEALAYKMQPAGHDKPAPRRSYPEPDRRLADALEVWLERAATEEFYNNNQSYWYHEALRLTMDLECDLDAAHGLLYNYQDHKEILGAGPFISTLYNKIPDTEIVYDLQLPVRDLGLWLSKNKILVNKSTVGSGFGNCAMGTIINCGKAEGNLGCSSLGYVINLGPAESGLGSNSKGPVINDGERSDFAWEKGEGLYINYVDTGYDSAFLMMDINGKCVGDKLHKGLDLYEYLAPIRSELQEIRTDYKQTRKFIENHPPLKLREDLLNIMKRYHHV